MITREVAEQMSKRMPYGFGRADAERVIKAFVATIKEEMRKSPTDGKFVLRGFGTLLWHRYRENKPKPRHYITLRMFTQQKHAFWGTPKTLVKSLKRSLENTPWFDGATARKSIEGGINK